MTKPILLRAALVCLVIGLLGICGCGPGGGGPPIAAPPMPVAPVAPAAPAEEPIRRNVEGPSLAGAQPDFQLSAEDYFRETKNDPEAAKAKFSGKVVEVTGKVTGVGRIAHRPMIVNYRLAAGQDKLDLVYCNAEGDDVFDRAQPGQTVTLRGSPLDGSRPYLFRGTIVRAAGDPCPRLTAAELAAEARADIASFRKKYVGKHLFVSGTVGFIARPNRDAIFVKDGETEVVLELDIAESHGALKTVKAGGPFRVLAWLPDYPWLEPTAKKVQFMDGLIVPLEQ